MGEAHEMQDSWELTGGCRVSNRASVSILTGVLLGYDLGYFPRCIIFLGYIFLSHFFHFMCYEIIFFNLFI